MLQPNQPRKLTAILSADVVGYSALMSRDEYGTLAAMQTLRSTLVDSKANQHRGRTIKLMGDGALMEFASVVDAVLFAVDVQQAVIEQRATNPETPRIAYRIGINIGDIIVDGDDIYGDGVNIAARLESLADPDGICVSKTVVDHIAGKLDLDLTPMGARKVKNIPVPIDAYKIELNDKSKRLCTPVSVISEPEPRTLRPRILGAGVIAAALALGVLIWQPWAPQFEPASISRMALPLPDKPSLVVLPFEDFSDDPEQAYFADGMTEDLITDLSKLSGIFVISRNSSWIYKDRAVKSQMVAEELGVQFILEGSVRRAGDQVRVNVQLIDALAGHHIWADRFDNEIGDVFALQDKVLQEISSALTVQLTAKEQAGLGVSETEFPAAYDAVLLGLDLLRRGSEEDVVESMLSFEKAIEIDPDYSRAYAGLALAHWRVAQNLWMSTIGGGFEKAWIGVLANLDRALAAPSALAYSLHAEILSQQGRHDEAFAELNKAMALAPNDPDVHVAKAKVLNATGRAPEAEAAVRYALRFDPHQATRYLRELGVAQLHQRNYQDTATTMRRVLSRDSDVVADYITLISALGHLGQVEDVPALSAKYDAIAVPNFFDPITSQESHYWWYGDMFGYDDAYRRHLVDGLVKAGVPPGAGDDLDAEVVLDGVTQNEGLYAVRGVPKVSIEKAKTLHETGKAVFLDVRAPLDFEAGHIPGAVNQSLLTDLTREALLDVATLDTPLLFSCHGPHCPYSAYASAKAALWGFRNARYFAGGFPGWKEAGYAVETSPTD